MSEQSPPQAEKPITIMRVSGGTDSSKLAGAIVSHVQQGQTVALDTIGAGPANQAIKAQIMANAMLSSSGRKLLMQPSFVKKEITYKGANSPTEVTAIRMYLFLRFAHE